MKNPSHTDAPGRLPPFGDDAPRRRSPDPLPGGGRPLRPLHPAFPLPAILRIHADFHWELMADFHYHCGNGRVVRVPSGTVTDPASVPRLLWPLFPPHGRCARAAIIHDWLYQQGALPRKVADGIFLEGMRASGVRPWRRWMTYWAVRLFGAPHYRGPETGPPRPS